LQTPYINNITYPSTGPGASLKAPFSGQKPISAISLIGVGVTQNPMTPTYYEINIGNNGPPNLNVFDNHSYGIYAVSTNFTSINNVFQNSINTNANDGIG